MKRNWNEDELLEHFVVVPTERKLIGNKTGASRLGFAVLLKYFQQEARFPSKKQDIPKVVVEFIAHQLEISADLFEEYRWGAGERNFTYHRKRPYTNVLAEGSALTPEDTKAIALKNMKEMVYG